jgi:hypothetical protein
VQVSGLHVGDAIDGAMMAHDDLAMAPSWCHTGVMELEPYVETLRQELAAAADMAGPEARELAERLAGALESAARLALLEALSAAADEITRDLAPGSVHVRLRGREPAFVVTPALPDVPAEPDTPVPAALPPAPADTDEAATARINFRLGDSFKGRIEQSADRAGLSVNSWLTRAAAAALESDAPARGADWRGARGKDRFTGWVH